MIEKLYKYSTTDEKAVEKIIVDENINYIHMVFNKNEGLPEHYSNSNVYMTVLRGVLSIKLNDQEIHEYKKGDILQIPFKTKMNVNNLHDDVLELIIVKAPAPSNYKQN
ncbi:MAG: cupin domain-containing protein [Clostridiaceae bacterium]